MVIMLDGQCDAWMLDWQAIVTVSEKRDMRSIVSNKRIYQGQTLVKVWRILELCHCRMLLNGRAKTRCVFEVFADNG
jgi:hypothetical protein